MTPSPLVEALRDAQARIRAAAASPSARPGDAAVARRVERDLEQAVDRLESHDGDKDLISIVCHDLKDPLASIVMGAGFLRKTAAGEDPASRRVVDAIARSADRMSQLVGDFHDLAKLETGRLQVERRPCDVAAAVRTALTALEPAAKERGVSLEMQAPEALQAMCDRGRVAQAVGKLAGNAIRFTPSGGRVTVTVARDGAVVRVTVRDTGRGIPAERLATVFDHVANARRTPRDGPGLGLAIVRGLAELQGGTVGVESQVGAGSAFTMELPAA